MRIPGNCALREKGLIIIGPVPIGTPFPYVAGHVVESESIRFICPNRRGCQKTVFTGVLIRKISLKAVRPKLPVRFELVAPCEFLTVESAACRPFKFSFGRQPLTCPFCV